MNPTLLKACLKQQTAFRLSRSRRKITVDQEACSRHSLVDLRKHNAGRFRGQTINPCFYTDASNS